LTAKKGVGISDYVAVVCGRFFGRGSRVASIDIPRRPQNDSHAVAATRAESF
jgi:hypothetical protein